VAASRLALADAVETGSVTLVGAGPGPAEHLTMKAIRALQGADVVLYGEGVSDEVLDLARREARRLLVAGVSGKGASDREGVALAVQLAAQGRQVVRLVPGDGSSEDAAAFLGALQRQSVASRLVPGVSDAAGGEAASIAALSRRTMGWE